MIVNIDLFYKYLIIQNSCINYNEVINKYGVFI